MIKELNLDEFIKTLHDLDKKLVDKKIIIRAVGGFALAWHHIRDNGLTADIDTLTDDYPEDIAQIIEQVGLSHGLDKWWLNNEVAAGDAEFLIESMDLQWCLANYGFKNITLYIANQESLLSLKLSALEDSALSGRTRDLEDTIRTLKALGYTKATFKEKLSYLVEEKPFAFRAISQAIW